MKISLLIRQTREAMGLSQEALARELRISVKSVNNYENESREPEALYLLALSNMAPEEFKEPLRICLPDYFLRVIHDYLKDKGGNLNRHPGVEIDAEVARQIDELARRHGKVDRSAIIRDALQRGLISLSSELLAKQQVKIAREAHKIVHSRARS